MNDLFIFGAGFIVTLFVSAAVGLLVWGAANEPQESQSESGA